MKSISAGCAHCTKDMQTGLTFFISINGNRILNYCIWDNVKASIVNILSLRLSMHRIK